PPNTLRFASSPSRSIERSASESWCPSERKRSAGSTVERRAGSDSRTRGTETPAASRRARRAPRAWRELLFDRERHRRPVLCGSRRRRDRRSASSVDARARNERRSEVEVTARSQAKLVEAWLHFVEAFRCAREKQGRPFEKWIDVDEGPLRPRDDVA